MTLIAFTIRDALTGLVIIPSSNPGRCPGLTWVRPFGPENTPVLRYNHLAVSYLELESAFLKLMPVGWSRNVAEPERSRTGTKWR